MKGVILAEKEVLNLRSKAIELLKESENYGYRRAIKDILRIMKENETIFNKDAWNKIEILKLKK